MKPIVAGHQEVLREVLAEFDRLRHPDVDPELEALQLALLLEDVFGLVIPDSDLDPKILRDPVAVAAIVARGHSGRA